MAHIPDQDLVAELARVTDHVTVLEQENVRLQDAVVDMTDRAAHSRDSIVQMRERLRAAREKGVELAQKLAAAETERNLTQFEQDAYLAGVERGYRAALNQVLISGGASSQLGTVELRVGVLEEKAARGAGTVGAERTEEAS